MKINMVTVKEYGDKVSQKVLVEEREGVLIVTTKEEWDRSQRESRAPIVVGFRREYLTESEREESI